MWAMCSRSSACRKNVSYADGRARSTLDDVVQTSVLTGLPTNMLRPSLEAASIDLAAQGSGSDSLAAAIARDGNFNTSRDLYSAGTLSAA
jgi:nitronate monooxygenase